MIRTMVHQQHSSNKFLIFFIFFTCLFLFATGDAKKEHINCIKYVFAPSCRGTAVKRSLKENWHKMNRPNHAFFSSNIDTVIQSGANKESPLSSLLISRLMKQASSPYSDYNNLR